MDKIKLKYNLELAKILNNAYNPEKAQILARFFKTGAGQYGEGDKFLGISMPSLHHLSKSWAEMSDKALEELLVSPYHEIRMLGALIMVLRYQAAKTDLAKSKAMKFYLQHRTSLNNWDLVDVTAPKVWGDYLTTHVFARKDLYKFARSKNLWERRLAMVACYALIRNNDFKDTIALSLLLLNDQEDLMHKAVGWMLRELGKRDVKLLTKFIIENGARMPRTCLRYAIEHFSKEERQKYLQIKYQSRN
ncbi:DNA alkylation repair protein [Patescibacteria group bacterium]|nr:DNA alkylation repair protein [Patescibacteria group bacterium]